MPSTIEWTDETWNPVTGCTRVSPGCDNCYMFALYPRLKAMAVPGYETAPDQVHLMPERLRAPLSWKSPRHVFVNSMSDVFHPRVPFDFVHEIFSVMEEASRERGHVFQVLTKRPGRAVAWWKKYQQRFTAGWPPNVWIGTSVENQKYAARLTVLSRLPAPVRFVSAEPLLEAVDLTPWLGSGALQWVIAGGESGPNARPMDPDWVRTIRDDCDELGVPFFFKQWGGRTSKAGGRLLDERTHNDVPTTLMRPTTLTNAESEGHSILQSQFETQATVTANIGV